MSDGFLYIVGGLEYAILTAVSALSLRRHSDKPIHLACWDEDAYEALSPIAGELPNYTISRFESCIAGNPEARRYTLDRSRMCDLSPFNRTISFDADTLITGNIDRLWPQEGSNEVVFTADLTGMPYNGSSIKDGLRRGITAWLQRQYGRLKYYPVVNTGSIGFSKSSEPFFNHWQRQMSGRPWSNDQVIRIFYMLYPHLLLDSRYNCIPPRGNVDCEASPCTEDDVRVWHFTNNIGRRYTYEWSYRLWWPVYHTLLLSRIGKFRELHYKMPGKFHRYFARWKRRRRHAN